MSCLPVAALVLAAGSASRMGKLKQILPFESSTLLRHAIAQTRLAGFVKTLVVVGAFAPEVQASIASEPVEIVQNAEWQRGMGGSIAAGMRQLAEHDEQFGAVAIVAGDQPFVTGTHLRAMATELSRQAVDAVAAAYLDTVGIPAVFGRPLFGRLRQMPQSSGAKGLLLGPGVRLASFPLPEAALDIDTPEDFARLAKRQAG